MPKEETRRKYKELMKDLEKKHNAHQRALDKATKHADKMKREYEGHMKMGSHKKMDYKEDGKGSKKNNPY